MKLISVKAYSAVKALVGALMRLAHPVVRVQGRENLPEGAAVLCCNHSAFSDPIWVLLAMKTKQPPRIMAKKELLETPALGWLYRKLGAFPVDRGNRDIAAIRTAMSALKNGEKLLIFPEGTRIRHGKVAAPHNGALMIAAREQAPVVPIYLTAKKHFWGRIDIVFGAPFTPDSAKPTQDELTARTQEMMAQIYAMGEEL